MGTYSDNNNQFNPYPNPLWVILAILAALALIYIGSGMHFLPHYK